jgi:hypothetical protein
VNKIKQNSVLAPDRCSFMQTTRSFCANRVDWIGYCNVVDPNNWSITPSTGKTMLGATLLTALFFFSSWLLFFSFYLCYLLHFLLIIILLIVYFFIRYIQCSCSIHMIFYLFWDVLVAYIWSSIYFGMFL